VPDMKTAEQYAASIVEKYHVTPDTSSPSHRAADEFIPLLKQWGKQYLLGLTLSGALQGFLESTGRTTEEKNRLCLPTGMPHTPFDYLRVILAGINTEMQWLDAPDLQDWLDHSRLNIMAGLEANADGTVLQDLQQRFFAALAAAFDALQTFATQATPQERARMFDPAPGDA